MHPMLRRITAMAITVLVAAGSARAQDGYVQTNLISNIPGMAQLTDPNLQDAWGISLSTTSPFWVSDQSSSLATLYGVNPTTGAPSINSLVVTVSNSTNAPPSPPPIEGNGPTGQVSTGAAGLTTAATDFNFTAGGSTGKAAFIFANLDGSISAWKGGLTASDVVATVSGASFTGLAIGNASSGPELYAADQNSTKIDVFNNNFSLVGSFSDPNATALQAQGITAFNVQNLLVNGQQTLFVAYANQAGTGGLVDEFTTNGTFIKTLIDDPTGTHLSAPWGMAIAPSGWGEFGGDLLVANNNGPGTINAYNLTTGAFVGSLTIDVGPADTPADLWGITFGNNGSGGSSNVLYFTAGLASNGDGLFGSISAVPEPSSAVLGIMAMASVMGGYAWRRRRRAIPIS